MSEKICGWLLRFYPSRFRERYGEEAFLLLRDRFRDERGFFPRLRLWMDMFGDLALSIPRSYREEKPALVGAAAQQRERGTPGFLMLEGKPPRPEALFFGGLLSLAAVGVFAVSIGHAGNYRLFRAMVAPPQSILRVRPSASKSVGFHSYDDTEQSVITSPDASSIPDAQQQPRTKDAAETMTAAAAGATTIDVAERKRVVAAAIANLKQHYFDPGLAQKMADALEAHQRNGDDNAVTTDAAFADALTLQMRDVSHDMHLVLVYSQTVLPDRPMAPAAADLARYRSALEQSNCTFEKIEMLPHNIGYLKLNSFPDPAICKSTAVAAMASLNRANALILDLRDNGGGYQEMVTMLASYLFVRPTNLYDPRAGSADQPQTSPVPGNRLADKPVYVLTSSTTISAAEDFCYNLKMLKRATFVGETTHGSAHTGVFHRIDDHFGMGISEVKAVNPYAKPDWEGIGVEPDVKVRAADALNVAEKLAENGLRHN